MLERKSSNNSPNLLNNQDIENLGGNNDWDIDQRKRRMILDILITYSVAIITARSRERDEVEPKKNKEQYILHRYQDFLNNL